MMICPDNECTGCFACATVCPKKAITMVEDKYGELHPKIKEDECIGCNLCLKVCPNNCSQTFYYPLKCYASWITDDNKRRTCASGGIATMMSEFIINTYEGVVFGARYDKDFTPVMSYTEHYEDLKYFKGSRYVQSIVGYETFRKVKQYLKLGRKILFIGTPCQISGLKSYLSTDYENLITVDLICHGCSPTKYFKEEINYIIKKYGLNNISDIRFRGNDRNNFCLSIWSDNNGQTKRIYRKAALLQPYFAGFLLGTTLRENCYSCKYARPDRISDITIGDFIGLGDTIKFPYSRYNVSSVSINTHKGESFYNEVEKSTPNMINIERDYSERLVYKPSLVEPFKPHESYSIFRKLYVEEGFVSAVRKALGPILRRNEFRNLLNCWTYIYRIPRKVLKIIINKYVK